MRIVRTTHITTPKPSNGSTYKEFQNNFRTNILIILIIGIKYTSRMIYHDINQHISEFIIIKSIIKLFHHKYSLNSLIVFKYYKIFECSNISHEIQFFLRKRFIYIFYILNHYLTLKQRVKLCDYKYEHANLSVSM